MVSIWDVHRQRTPFVQEERAVLDQQKIYLDPKQMLQLDQVTKAALDEKQRILFEHGRGASLHRTLKVPIGLGPKGFRIPIKMLELLKSIASVASRAVHFRSILQRETEQGLCGPLLSLRSERSH